MELTNEQWSVVEAILPPDQVRADGRGRPWSDRRIIFNGILWILRTGAPWKDLPSRYGPYQTAHRRFQNWVRDGTIEKVLLVLAEHLREAGGLDLKECFVDGTFVPAKKGGDRWARPNAARVPKFMGIADGHGLPLALRTESASPAEVKLVSATLEERIVADVPERLYDCANITVSTIPV